MDTQVEVSQAELTRDIEYFNGEENIFLFKGKIVLVDPTKNIGYSDEEHFHLVPGEYTIIETV